MFTDSSTDPPMDPEVRLLRFLLAWTDGSTAVNPADLESLPVETRQLLAVAEPAVLLRLAIECLDRLRPDELPPTKSEDAYRHN